MNDFSVDMNEYLPLRDVVFNTLRKAILKGELKPGERLMEIALAEKLGVSRTPVREAMTVAWILLPTGPFAWETIRRQPVRIIMTQTGGN